MTSTPMVKLHRAQQSTAGKNAVPVRTNSAGEPTSATSLPKSKRRAKERKKLQNCNEAQHRQAFWKALEALGTDLQDRYPKDTSAQLLSRLEALLRKNWNAVQSRKQTAQESSFAQQSIECEPIECEPIECEPIECEPTECEPTECELADCEPIECEPIECEPTEIELADKPSTVDHVLSDSCEVDTSELTRQAQVVHPGHLHFAQGWRLSQQETMRLRCFFPEVVLFAPKIPPNTGTVARLCAALSARLHLIEPLGFDISEKSVRRAGLDYWESVDVTVHGSFADLLAVRPNRRIVFVETGSQTSPSDFNFEPGDLLVFGSETTGIPSALLEDCLKEKNAHVVTIPMYHEKVRSINLANSVSMVLFQATEQLRKEFLSSMHEV